MLYVCMGTHFKKPDESGFQNSGTIAYPYLSKTSVFDCTLIANNLPMQRLHSNCSSCAPAAISEFSFCDIQIMQLSKVIGMTLEQTPVNLAFSKV